MLRCGWCCDHGIVQKYHDDEWGIPFHDDRKHFEYLSLGVMQCGLNWTMMLKKREIFRACFDDFDYNKIAQYGEDKVTQILETEEMIKSKTKVDAIIHNANCFLAIIEECGSFDDYIWAFSNHRTFIYRNHKRGLGEGKNGLSDTVSSDLKKRGFKYLSSVTIYSHLQACGIINDHATDCWMYEILLDLGNIRFIDE